MEPNSSRSFGSVSTDSERETVEEGSQELYSAAPLPSEPSPKVTNEIENTNVLDVNKVNSSEAEPSKTVQVEDKAEDPVQRGNKDHPSPEDGSMAPPAGPLFLRRLSVSQTLDPGVGTATTLRKRRTLLTTGEKLSLRQRSHPNEAELGEQWPTGPVVAGNTKPIKL